jgi:ribosomal peptide maturation radical SAM protein 1
MIAIVNMPYQALMYPSLASGLIKAKLNAAGLACVTHNYNFLFAKIVGMQDYHLLCLQRSIDAHISEWLFARQAWQSGFTLTDEQFLELASDTLFMTYYGDRAGAILREIRDSKVPAFLDIAAERLLSSTGLKVVGFSCGFFQSNASLALIQRLKQVRPDIKIACGGASFHDVMGLELMEKCDAIDAVCLGEADEILEPLFRALSENRDPEGLCGVVYRDRHGRVRNGPPERPASVKVLENNPHPDYEEYVVELQKSGILEDKTYSGRLFMAIETSRGCWKGEKQHCAFCGLNNQGLQSRRISAERAEAAVTYLLGRYPIRKIQFTDLILPREYSHTLLPRLKDNPLVRGVKFWAETSTSMSRAEVAQIAAAGIVYLQVGVESLSTHLLKCIRKGVTTIKNVHMLKLCRIFGIHPLWHLLLRIPGERKEDYDGIAALIPKIVHYDPPIFGVRLVEMQRFSPYFNEPGRWAEDIRPRDFYRALYPEDRVDIAKVAYFFDACWLDVLPDKGAYQEVIDSTKGWMQAWRFNLKDPIPELTWENLPGGGMRITDTRRNAAAKIIQLTPWEANVYRAIDDPAGLETLSGRPALMALGTNALEMILESFVNEQIAIREKDRFLGLALPKDAPEPDPELRRSLAENPVVIINSQAS